MLFSFGHVRSRRTRLLPRRTLLLLLLGASLAVLFLLRAFHHGRVVLPGDKRLAAAAAIFEAQAVFVRETIRVQHDYKAWLDAGDQLALIGNPALNGSLRINNVCSYEYSRRFIEEFRSTRAYVCGGATTPSRAECHLQRRHGLTATPLITCFMQNMVLADSGAFMGQRRSVCDVEGAPRETLAQCGPAGAAGSVQMACQLPGAPTSLQGQMMADWGVFATLERPLRGAQVAAAAANGSSAASRSAADAAARAVATACAPGSPRAVEHPVLLLTRRDTTNSFHHTEHAVSVFTALAALQLPELMTDGLEVVVTDHYPLGFYLDTWRQLSIPYRLRHLPTNPFPPGTCLRRAILAPAFDHEQSLVTMNGVGETFLCPSPVMRAAAAWLRALFPQTAPGTVRTPTNALVGPAVADAISDGAATAARALGRRAVQSPGVARMAVVWVSRARFERRRHGKLTYWQQERMLRDEKQVQDRVWAAVSAWNWRTCDLSGYSGRQRRRLEAAGDDDAQPAARSHTPAAATARRRRLTDSASLAGGGRANGTARGNRVGTGTPSTGCKRSSVMFDFQVMELSDMRLYPDQLWSLMRAGVIVGVHGAGLSSMVYQTPPAAALVEIVAGGNTHYQNMAAMLGVYYIPVGDGSPRTDLDLEQVAEGVNHAMDWVAYSLDGGGGGSGGGAA